MEKALDRMEILYNIFGVYTWQKGRKTCTQVLLAAYCLFIMFVQLGNSLRVILYYKHDETFGPTFIRKLILTTFTVPGPITTFLLARGFRHMQKIKVAIDDISMEDKKGFGFILRSNVVTFSCIVFGCCFLPTIVSIVINVYGYSFSKNGLESYEDFIYPLSPNSSYALPYIISIAFAGSSVMSLSWVLVGMLTMCTFILCERFYIQSLQLFQYQKQLYKFNKSFRIEKERLQYEKLLDVLEHVDGLLSAPMSLVLGSGVVITCLTVYNLVYSLYDAVGSTLDIGLGFLAICIGMIILIDCAFISWAVS